MSEFKVTVVRVGPITKHENADTLGLTKVFDYPVIVKLGDFKEGDFAIYVPVDAVVPKESPRWDFLQGHNRIKAKRLRGIFSMGLLTKMDVAIMAKAVEEGSDVIGKDVADILQITKYEPPLAIQTGGDNEHCPFFFPTYTDVEGLRRWPDMLKDGEEVQLNEKIHGANMRALYKEGRLWMGSHTSAKKPDAENLWWRAAYENKLEETLAKMPGILFYGEVFGSVQDLHYGCNRQKGKIKIAFFDAFDLEAGKYLDLDDFEKRTLDLGLSLVPKLYRGPWSKDLVAHAEGKSLIDGADHVREGLVVRPVKERFDERIQRVILKRHGEGYLLRKEG